MSEHVVNSDGTPFAVSFIKGVPSGTDEIYLFLLDDGSIHQGVIVTTSTAFQPRAISTTNPVGGFHEKFEIPLRRVAGYAFCQPLYDTRDRSMWFEADFESTNGKQG